jgi:hypothetical protein
METDNYYSGAWDGGNDIVNQLGGLDYLTLTLGVKYVTCRSYWPRSTFPSEYPPFSTISMHMDEEGYCTSLLLKFSYPATLEVELKRVSRTKGWWNFIQVVVGIKERDIEIIRKKSTLAEGLGPIFWWGSYHLSTRNLEAVGKCVMAVTGKSLDPFDMIQ